MDNELISIIVPVYNTEVYLDRCIRSCLEQSYDNIEIILVNDGSSDGSLIICQKYATEYNNIKVINQNNSGVSVARNVGILASKGQYVTFLDSDDELCVDAIRIMYDLIINHSADIVEGKMISNVESYEYDTKENIFYREISKKDAVRYSLEEVSFSACAKLFKKSSIHDIYFEEGRKINEDGYFIFECYLKQPKIILTNAVVYLYTIRENSSSRSIFSDKYLDMLFFLDKKKTHILKEYPEFMSELQQLELRTNLNLLQLLCVSKNQKYLEVEKNCLEVIKKIIPSSTTSFRKYEKRLYYIVRFRLFLLYKIILQKL